jgi:hypothetical protein
MKLLLTTILALGPVACCAAQAERSADYTRAAAAYKEWVDACRDTGMPDPNEPHFRTLLALPDADLFFLEGLHGPTQTVRRTSV